MIFNHDTLHEGLPVTEGVKYIIRTEVMYRRVDREMIPNPQSYQQDENYLATLALYQKSWQLEQGLCRPTPVPCLTLSRSLSLSRSFSLPPPPLFLALSLPPPLSLFLSLSPPPLSLPPSLTHIHTEGLSQEFTDTYLEAIRKQREAQRSVGSDAADIFQQPLPYEVYLTTFSYLSVVELCRVMRVCKVNAACNIIIDRGSVSVLDSAATASSLLISSVLHT